jgi:hypothetical protein
MRRRRPCQYGTDQQAVPGSMLDYAQWAQIVAATLRDDSSPEEASKIVSVNCTGMTRNPNSVRAEWCITIAGPT